MSTDQNQPLSKAQLRQRLRQRRRTLHPWQQHVAAQKLCKHLRFHRMLLRSQHLGFYIAQDGEINPAALLRYCNDLGKHCYLPVIQNGNRLMFAAYKPGQPLTPNRLGIPEPHYSQCLPPNAMDVVFMPLVGFDAKGHRLGMGGGFYDRSFAFKQRQPQASTKLVGLAHSCQQVECLPSETWDVDADAIVTDAGWLNCRATGRTY